MIKRLAILIATLAFAGAAFAVDPEDRLDDPALEARAREISKDLRCLVCAGQTIDESTAPVAHALRKMVRERLAAGDTDQQVLDAVANRYGDYALLKPRFNAENIVLWAGPFLVLVLGGWGAARFIRASRTLPEEPPLSDEERDALKALKDA
jgi:cytochrome c-type biogenesis protein CcmH